MNHRLTIIIATFNSENTLEKSLESVSNLEYDLWECLIVDGGSSDNTIEIVESFCEKDNRFRCISEPDKGIYDAFNKGWRNAKGEWIYYLGSDDWMDPNGMSMMMKVAETTDAAIVSGGVIVHHEGGGSNYWNGADGKPHWGGHQGMITRKSVIEKMGGFNLKFKIMGDKDLNVRILSAGYNVEVVNDITVAHFSRTGSSASFKGQLLKCRENYWIAKKGKTVRFPRIYALYLLYIGVRSSIYQKLKKTFKSRLL